MPFVPPNSGLVGGAVGEAREGGGRKEAAVEAFFFFLVCEISSLTKD